ncbi:MAG: hypothetical protein RQ752_12310, partial [Thermohalobaculum sp.]|nr:hypothetical protein [Thermohalobaculum sp.]
MTAGAQTRLLRLFVRFAGARLWWTAALVGLAALLEGVGVLLLVPLISIVLDAGGAAGTALGRAGEIAAGGFAALGVSGHMAQLGLGLGAFLAVVALRAAVDIARSRVMIELSLTFVVDLRRQFFEALGKAPWRAVAQIDRETAGHSLSIDLGRAEGFVWSVWTSLIAVTSLGVYAALAMAVAPGMTLIALGIGSALFAALRPFRRRAALLGGELSAADAGLYGHTGRVLAGLKPARAHRLGAAYAARSVAAAERVAARAGAIRMDLATGGIVMQTAVAVAAALVVLLGVTATDAGAEALIAMLLILTRVARPFQNLQHALQNMSSAAAAHAMAEARLRAAREGAAGADGAVQPVLPAGAPDLRLDGVTVGADGAPGEDAGGVILSDVT